LLLVACTADTGGLAYEPEPGVDAAPPNLPPDAAVPPDGPPPPPPDAALPADAPPQCPAGYAYYDTGTAYRVASGFLTWLDAERDCEDDGFGTHLAVIQDQHELMLLDGLASGQVWVGLSDRIDEDVWLWVTGEPAFYLPFKNGEPNDSGPTGEDCVELMADEYNDEGCDFAIQSYVCECDGVPADESSYLDVD
jgi:hypothetical protein